MIDPSPGLAFSTAGAALAAQARAAVWPISLVADPTVAYVLLVLGLTALLFEVSHPGHLVSGVTGTIITLVALSALGLLPVNLVGVALVVAAFFLLAAEILSPGTGALGAAGIAMLLAGSVILSWPAGGFVAVSPFAVVAVMVAVTAVFLAIVRSLNRLHRRRVVTGREGLIGATGEARTALDPQGYVVVEGELWRAVSPLGPIRAGERVQVASMDGYRLLVFSVDDVLSESGRRSR